MEMLNNENSAINFNFENYASAEYQSYTKW